MKAIDRLTVKYRNRIVGILSLTPDDKFCAFEYDKNWLVDGFSISPLELPTRLNLSNEDRFESSIPSRINALWRR